MLTLWLESCTKENLNYKFHDKRDDFSFPIVNLPL
jgi:hypothetical protein